MCEYGSKCRYIHPPIHPNPPKRETSEETSTSSESPTPNPVPVPVPSPKPVSVRSQTLVPSPTHAIGKEVIVVDGSEPENHNPQRDGKNDKKNQVDSCNVYDEVMRADD
jgi:hypothetical protein